MIRFDDISLRFKDKLLFDGLHLTVNKGEKVVLRAPSGSGKSTLLKMVLGFVRPDGGQIHFDGEPLSRSTIHKVRKSCSYVSQDVDLRNDVVEDTIKAVFDYKANRHLGYDRERVLSLLETLSLDKETLGKRIMELSGGERQRLGFVLCLLLERDVWLLDEVTSGLENKLKAKLVDLIASSDKTVLAVSHDDVWLGDGRIREVSW